MPNIKFNYLYRDAGNYKRYHSVVFAYPDNISLPVIKALIDSKLIDKMWFYAKEWNLPEVFPENFNLIVDPTWHEFESVEYTDERPSANLNSLN